MKNAMLTISIAALCLAGCGKKEEPAAEATTASPAADGMGAASPAPAASPGQAFADAAAASDMFEMESSRLAETKASSPKIKAFAGQMVKAHTDSTAKLKAAAAQASPAITPAPQMTAQQQQTLEALRAASGPAFDQAYKDAQVNAHQMTLDTLKGYAANGDAPALKSFAAELTPIVTAHLNMAKGL
jgi:putative membrane protein